MFRSLDELIYIPGETVLSLFACVCVCVCVCMCQCVCVFKSVFVVVNLYLVLNTTSHGKGKDLPPHLGLIKAALKKRSLHSVGLSSYECTREVGRAREKRLIVIRRSRVLLYLIECSHNLPSASITR